ncbi:TonB-dependent receptor [Ereboglobus luteus]|uniref:TonB-dependent receptor n=1 Tax=Ereboglobus luteus TaxID=1796921 RepID=UPI000D561528|nr:TonB-dependent receptor plug domain-containing protein [Ereboglobus luteus]
MVTRISIPSRVLICLFSFFAAASLWAGVDGPARHALDIPSDSVENAVKKLSHLSGVDILVPSRIVRGVRTKAVKGEYTAREALELMLKDTRFVVEQDAKTGALTVRRAKDAAREKKAAVKRAAAERAVSDDDLAGTDSDGSLAATSSSSTAARPTPLVPNPGSDVDEEVVIMTPFEVVASTKGDGRYETSRSNAITGTNLPLDRVPLTADIFNAAFMEDMGVVDLTEMLTKYAGFSEPVMGSAESARGFEPGDETDFKNLRVRGLEATNQRREGFLHSEGTTLDSFDLDASEYIHGSQSLLYGAGGPGGVVNFVGKRARFNRKNAIASMRFDSEGTRRYQGEINFGTRKFAVRAVGVRDDTKYWKQDLGRRHRGVYATVAVRPVKWLVIRAEYRKFNRLEPLAQSYTAAIPNEYLPEWARSPSSTYASPRLRNLLYREGDGYLGFKWSTVDSVGAGTKVRSIDHEYYGVSVEARVSRNLSLQLRVGHDERDNFALASKSSAAIYHPEFTNSTLAAIRALYPELDGKWIYRVSYGGEGGTGATTGQVINSQEGFRLAGNYRFNVGKFSRHEFNLSYQMLDTERSHTSQRFYKTDANGNIIIDPDASAADSLGRIPLNTSNSTTSSGGGNNYWNAIHSGGWYGVSWPFTRVTHPITGDTYKLDDIKHRGSVTPTASNPLGLNSGDGTYRIFDIDEDAVAGTLTSFWWDERLTSMVGYRRERFVTNRRDTGIKLGPNTMDTATAGFTFDIWNNIRLFYNYSTNSNIREDIQIRDLWDNPLPYARGTTHEAGFKFNTLNRRLSGAASFFHTLVTKEAISLSGFRNEFDPEGINGRHIDSTPYTIRDRLSKGFSLTLTVKPLSGWEIYLRLTHAPGTVKNTNNYLPILYNDQFHTMQVGGNTVVAQKQSDGSLAPLMVNETYGDDTSPLVPLQVDWLRYPDINPDYYAPLDSAEGWSLRPSTARDLLSQSGVGTGRTGLPLTAHQLRDVTAAEATHLFSSTGEKITGYTVNTFAMENTYRFTRGPLRGLTLGLNTQYRGDIRRYYYNDVADGGKRKLWKDPNRLNFDATARYTLRVSKSVTWSINLHIVNLLDKQRIIPVASSTTGEIILGRPYYSPRLFILSNTIRF